MISRPMLLVFLLLVLIITSQFEWRQQLVVDIDPTPSITEKQQSISKREKAVKEKSTKFISSTSVMEAVLGFIVNIIVFRCILLELITDLTKPLDKDWQM
ncbi:hypothetical protein SLEP1_g59725 [Rubroshorea leprosula]|uniref:Uncharacterized protein n=1 Tax=Rubroshorea leprosula TaxID=152421 RepID=A0AAV5I8Y1_9ROSI|nr:hypothetical protein SLEP1_g7341 [Rubroshorea leprosula]GKV53188.1 hypothetical protein SLEP1_g59725 [Rubroshorea leprosula]